MRLNYTAYGVRLSLGCVNIHNWSSRSCTSVRHTISRWMQSGPAVGIDINVS